MDKCTDKSLRMAPIPLRSSSFKDIEKITPTPFFPQRSTSLPCFPSTSTPVSEGLKILPSKACVPPLINKQLPPLPASIYDPRSATEDLRLLSATVYVLTKTSKDLRTLPATKYSRKLSDASRISNDPYNFSLVDPKPVTFDTPVRTQVSLLSPPAKLSSPLRKKACRSPLLPLDEVEVESLVLVTVQPPTPGTVPDPAPTSTSMEAKNAPKLDTKKHKKGKLSLTKSKNRQSMLLANKITSSVTSSTKRANSLYRSHKKVKHDSMALYRCRRRSSFPRGDSRKSIFDMIQRPEEATSPPPSVAKRTFEQMYLQILKERWAYYRQLDAMREADEKREAEENLAAHPVVTSPSPPSVPPSSTHSGPPSGQRSARRAHREARASRKLPTISENVVMKTTTIAQNGKNRVRVSSPHLFSGPRSPRERLQQEEQKLKSRWGEWLKSSKKEKKPKKLVEKPVEKKKSGKDEFENN